MACYYFDTNALYKYYRGGEKGAEALERMVGQSLIFVSALTQLELIQVFFKEQRRGNLKKRAVQRLVEKMRRDTTTDIQSSRPFKMTAFSLVCFEQAAALLLQHGSDLAFGSLDALHLAIAQELQAAQPGVRMVTSDRGVKAVCERIKLAYVDPETDKL
ncbi:MAG: type II toxin-antitoxin system VapC family toxin [Anaerolineae bacterium]|nr:type II toxin-antitoxin system VapC family toxin [Anaerolineae bacterium]MDW8172789.1 type II toxin-antitoxin system VapC family toxin [Anaerolineae bacterium]